MGNAVSKTKQIVIVTGESFSQKDPGDLQSEISSLKQHSTRASEACYSTYAKLLPKKNEASTRSRVSHAMKSMKQNGVMDFIEKDLRSLQCLNCSVEEIAISLKTVTNRLSSFDRSSTIHRHLAALYAIYFWVAYNISYDVLGWADIVEGKKFPNVSCEYVLENRLTVCNGYANIFLALANEMGYKAVVIDGHFRVSLCDQKQQYPLFFSPNSANTHSWNAVFLEGSWHLFDCTYGSGILSEGCFKSKFTSEYFIVPPEQLIFSHWPDDHHWQLLQTPITLQELQPLQVLSPSSFCLGTIRTQLTELLKIESNAKDPVINIELKIVHDTVVIATLSDWPASNEQQCASGYDYDTLVFIDQSEKDKKTIYAIAHDQGMYQIKLFIKTPFSEANFLCSYLISCQVSSNADTLGFPVVRSYANGFNLTNWRDPYEPNLHYIAECCSGEMIFQFEANDVSKLVHFITPFKVIDNTFPDVKYHHYSAIQPFQGHWKLHVVFPKYGLWTVCIASKENNDEIVSLMNYEVNVMQIKERRGYLSYPYIETDAVNIQLSEPICTNGDKIIKIGFSSKELIAFHSCISNGKEEFTQYSKVTENNPNIYSMQVIIPKPGNWTVYLFGKQSVNESRSLLMTCFFEVSCCLEKCFFPIVNDVVVEKYHVKHEPILMQSNSTEFKTTLKSSNKLSLQTRFHEGWLSRENKIETSTMVDHLAIVNVINSREYVVKVMFPKTGRWTLIITAISPDFTQQEDVLMVLKLKANIGNNYCNGLFIKPFPAFYSNQFQWHSESDLYDFQVNDQIEILHKFSILSNCTVECNMFQIQDPNVMYENQTILLFSNTGYTLKMLFPTTGEWCVQLLSSDGLALQLYYSVHKAMPNVKFPWMQRSFYERYRLAIVHPTLQFPSSIIYPTVFEMKIQKPNSTELIHEASVNEVIMRGATRLIAISDSNQYLLTVAISKPGTWEIRLFAQICSSAWTHVLSHKMTADDVYY